MKKIVYLITVSLILTTKGLLFAQDSKIDSLRFSGTVMDPSGKPLLCKVRLSYSTDDGGGATESIFKFFVQTDGQGRFSAKLPNLDKPYAIYLCVCDQKTLKPFFRTQTYFAESGDNVKANIKIDTLTSIASFDKAPYKASFSGHGAEKYQVAWQLQNPFIYNGLLAEDTKLHYVTRVVKDPQTNKDKIRKWKDASDIIRYLEDEAKIVRKYKFKKDSLIAESKVSFQMRKLLQFTYGGFEQSLSSHWRMRCEAEFYSCPNYREQIASIYMKYENDFSEQPDDNAIYSRPYLGELSKRLIFATLIKDKTERINIRDYYNAIKTKYAGGTRDYLWRNALVIGKSINRFFLPYSSKVKDSILVDALHIVKMPLAKSFMENELVVLRKESLPVFDGEFTTLTGQKLRLSSLRGKVILLDVWFNGCVGCAEFHRAFETIYPKFRDNKNFIVLSVNVDKTKERWINGIDSKHYTSRNYNYINVTTGSWFDHPFMNYYNITGASYTMLINDDGKILPMGTRLNDLSNDITEALSKITIKTK